MPSLDLLGSLKRMAKLTLEERRLKALKQQLFGKEREVSIHRPENNFSQKEVSKSADTSLINLDYIKSDLIRISVLVSFAVSFQLILYFASLKNLINLDFHF